MNEQSRGLNTKLDDAAVAIPDRLLIIHGDLPLVTPHAITDPLDTADNVIAHDRQGQYTNAIAIFTRAVGLVRTTFSDAIRSWGESLFIVRGEGLTGNIDTPNELAHVITQNFKPLPHNVQPQKLTGENHGALYHHPSAQCPRR